MIENRSRRWSFQFIILPLLRDDSSALKLLSTMGRRRSWEVRSNASGTTRTRGEKLLFSESPPASLTPPYTNSSTPTTFMDKLRGGWKRPSTSPGKVLTIFRQDSSPQPSRSCSSLPRRSRGAYDAPSIIRAYSSGFCSRSGIRKTRATVYVYIYI